MTREILHKVGLLLLLSLGMSVSYAGQVASADSSDQATSLDQAASLDQVASADQATPGDLAASQAAPGDLASQATPGDLASQAAPGDLASQAASSDNPALTDNTTSLTPTDQAAPVTTADPLEGFNRAMFTFNDKLDAWILKPVATLYNKIMPKPLNMGVNNFFNNIGTVPTIANDLLQLHFNQFANDAWRLGVNSTVGVGGLFDIADRMQLKRYSNDFGLTMAYWGYKNSNYLVLPFFGPSTFRDGVSLPVDYFLFSVYPYIEPPSLRYQVFGLGVIDLRAQLLKYQSVMEEATLDRYIFIRNAYLQHRAYQIDQNQKLGTGERAQGNMRVVPVLNAQSSL